MRQRIFGTGRGEKVDHAQLEIQLGLAEAQLVSLHAQSSKQEDMQIVDLEPAKFIKIRQEFPRYVRHTISHK